MPLHSALLHTYGHRHTLNEQTYTAPDSLYIPQPVSWHNDMSAKTAFDSIWLVATP